MDLLHAADGMEIWPKFLGKSRTGQKYMCLFFSSFGLVLLLGLRQFMQLYVYILNAFQYWLDLCSVFYLR